MRRVLDMRRSDGFTLFEVLIAMVVILIAVIGMVVLMDRASAGTSENKARQTSTNLTRDLLETAQGLSYASITSSTQLVTAMQGKGFPDDVPATPGWDIKRNGLLFTVTAAECSVDDPHDGSGVHPAGGNFCSDSAAGSADSNPDDYKRVTFTVSPPVGVGPPITQTTVLGSNRPSNPGGGGGGGGAGGNIDMSSFVIDTTAPAPQTTLYNGQVACGMIVLNCNASGQNTTAVSPKQVYFTATTASSAQMVKLSVDGTVVQTVSGPATTFALQWNLPDSQPDGQYTVAAQAFDSTGNVAVGDPKRITVTLNRYVPDPFAFTPASAGRNHLYGQIPEVETYPSNTAGERVDRDITGFQVIRFAGRALGVLGCQTNSYLARSCQDTGAPACCSSTLQYRLVPFAVNPDGSQQLANGQPALSADVNLSNTRPCNPSNVLLSRAGTVVTITWTNPGVCSPGTTASGDPNSGDCVDFFRVYSKTPSTDTTAFTFGQRVDRTPFGNPVSPCGANSTEQSNSIMLFESDATPKRYQVTSVDTHLDESTGVIVTG